MTREGGFWVDRQEGCEAVLAHHPSKPLMLAIGKRTQRHGPLSSHLVGNRIKSPHSSLRCKNCEVILMSSNASHSVIQLCGAHFRENVSGRAETDLSNSSERKEDKQETLTDNKPASWNEKWICNFKLRIPFYKASSSGPRVSKPQSLCQPCALLQHTWIKWMAHYNGCWRCNSNIWFSCVAAVMNLKYAGQ